MKSSLNKTSDVTATIVIEIEKADYQEKVEKSLNQLRQKANIPGFRQGKVPKGMVQKMYGKNVLIEEINNLVSEELPKFIQENNLRILGEPVATEGNDKMLDLENDETFTFYFDIALTPEFDLVLDKTDKLTHYNVIVDEENIDKQITSYRQQMGSHEKVEGDTQVLDILKGTLTELKGGRKKKDGIVVEDAVLMPEYMKDEEIKASFLGKKIGDNVVFHPKKAYDNHESEVASLLQTTKEAIVELDSDFRFTIKEITRLHEAELNQALFDRALGPGAATTEEEFRAKVAEAMLLPFTPHADFRFMVDAKNLMVSKMENVVFPDQFLKDWLTTKEDKTPESVEEEYPSVLENLKFHLAKEKLVEENSIKVEKEDLEATATASARAQFSQYGMNNVPEEMLQNYVNEMLNDQEKIRGIYDRAVENKLMVWLKETVDVTEKDVTVEEFTKLLTNQE